MTDVVAADDEKTSGSSRKVRLSGIKRRSQPGAVPGTLLPHHDASSTRIQVAGYGPKEVLEQEISGVDEIAALRGRHPVLWIDVVGLEDAARLMELGEAFGLHPLSLEDVINVHQRPKVEEFEDHVFVVARMLTGAHGVETEQVSMFLGADYLITFQEQPGDCFEPVRRRIRDGRGRIREAGPDYLCYALIDAIVDGYFPALENYGETLEDLEDAVVVSPEREHIGMLHDHKRDLLMLRRSVWPHREMINALIRDGHALITEPTRVYLRDCYDHAIQLMDIIETYREIASGLIDVYISSVSAKLNEVMKVLTIIATIFIPLGFIAGLYGMNFDSEASPWNMPELRWAYGYPAVLTLMAVIGGGMLYYFWRKGWIGHGPRRRRRQTRQRR